MRSSDMHFTSSLLLVGLVAALAQEPVYDCKLPPNCLPKTQKYLTSFGYLDPDKECQVDDIRAALTKFQEMNIGFMGLEVTGECDNITKLVMTQPRCGCHDIVKKKMMPPQNFIGPAQYRTGSTKWNKKTLTWRVLKYPQRNRLSKTDVDSAMERGLKIWADQTSLSFVQVEHDKPDITIKFEVRRHTNNPPYFDFDGPGNVLAHAFFPESGVVHFDDDENFVLGHDQGTELYIVAAHEFGHTLGISHSNIEEALMAPYYRYSDNLRLHSDDIAAIQSIYGGPDRYNPTTRAPTPRPTPAPTEPSRPRPAYCNLRFKATFKLNRMIYAFTRELDTKMKSRTYVYVFDSNGRQVMRKPIENVFNNSFTATKRRRYPYRVDAAEYVPNKNIVFLLSGSRAYTYDVRGSEFYLRDGYPRWMDTDEFPERPRAAIAMPYLNYNAYYMLIFGSTMVWDWNLFTNRVGAWAYPIDVYGREMPQQVNAAYLESRDTVMFIKGDKSFAFNIRYRRVMSESDIKPIKETIFKGTCS